MTHAKYFALVGMLVLLALMIAPASAATLSITSVSMPASVNLGESFTLAAQISATSVNTGAAQLSGSPLPTQISCTPTAAQSVTLSDGSGSASWNCTGNVAGDYSNEITVTVTDADSQAPQASTQTGLTVLAPASITAAASTSVSSVDINCGSSATFNYTIGVNNAGDIDTSGVAMTPSVSGLTSYSLSPSSYSAQSVGAKSLKNFHFIVTVAQTGILNFAAITVSSTNGGSDTTGVNSVTVTNSTGGCPTTSATPVPTTASGTSYVAPIAVQEATTVDTIPAGTSKTITVTKAADIGINAIKIAVKNTVTGVKVTTAQLTSLPASISAAPAATGGTYKYVEISATNVQSGDIDKVTLGFQVARSWATANGINVATIALNRWADNKWNKLPSTKTNEDSTYYYFDAESPGLSTFAITGEKAATPTAPTTTAPTTVTTPTATPAPSTPVTIPTVPPIISPETGKITPLWALVIAAVVMVIAAYVYQKQKGQQTKKGAPPSQKNYSYQPATGGGVGVQGTMTTWANRYHYSYPPRK